VVLKSLWVKVPPPQGIRLKRKDAPKLFRLIATLRQRSGTPRFHRVLIIPIWLIGRRPSAIRLAGLRY